jgi:hypothetical protein
VHVLGSSQESSTGPLSLASQEEIWLGCGRSHVHVLADRIEFDAPEIIFRSGPTQTVLSPRGVQTRGATIGLRGEQVALQTDAGAELALSSEAQLRGTHVRLAHEQPPPAAPAADRPPPARIELRDALGHPVPHAPFRIVLADGRIRTGVLDEHGRAKVTLDEQGTISFPGHGRATSGST